MINGARTRKVLWRYSITFESIEPNTKKAGQSARPFKL